MHIIWVAAIVVAFVLKAHERKRNKLLWGAIGFASYSAAEYLGATFWEWYALAEGGDAGPVSDYVLLKPYITYPAGMLGVMAAYLVLRNLKPAPPKLSDPELLDDDL
ncbi:MAG: hypothetical protein AAFX87_13480 [Bacteroidota bacterium]